MWPGETVGRCMTMFGLKGIVDAMHRCGEIKVGGRRALRDGTRGAMPWCGMVWGRRTGGGGGANRIFFCHKLAEYSPLGFGGASMSGAPSEGRC